jgi:Domain of unknown function (DUF4282)
MNPLGGAPVEKGFLSSLFDVSFSSLITTRVIKVLYILSMIVIGIATLFFVVAGFAQSGGSGIVALIVAPLVALLYLIYARVLLEVVICLFRIMETNAEMASLQRAAAGPGTPPPLGPTVHDPPEPPSSSPPPHPV